MIKGYLLGASCTMQIKVAINWPAMCSRQMQRHRVLQLAPHPDLYMYSYHEDVLYTVVSSLNQQLSP